MESMDRLRYTWILAVFLVNCAISERTYIRLHGGSSPNEGRLEVYHYGWGTVCDDYFGYPEAKVVCRMLGYHLVVPKYYGSAHFGEGTGTIFMDDLNCVGNERDIGDCPFNGWGSNNCEHSEDAGVACKTFDLKLVGGSSRYEGRLEVKNTLGEWGVVVSGGTTQVAEFVCRHLGMEAGGSKIVPGSKFGRGPSRSFTANFTCILNDGCTSDPFTNSAGGHGSGIGIRCAHTEVRLVDGRVPFEGRVEVLHNGVWGTICADRFRESDAKAICNSIRGDLRNETVTIYSNGEFGRGQGPTWLSDIQCTGYELDIMRCRNVSWSYKTCSSGHVASVRCPHTNIRLTGGVGPWEGRLEVYHAGNWGTVCSQGFGQPEADLVCRMLGYDIRDVQPQVLPNSYFPSVTSRRIVLDQLGCSGYEPDISLCRTQDWGSTNCSRSQEVGVRCQTKQIRLHGGSHPLEGRVEVKVNGSWTTVCDSNWDDLDATTVCRSLLEFPIDRDVVGKAFPGARFGPGSGRVGLSDVHCNGTEEDLFHCQFDQHRRINCDHSRDAGVSCSANNTVTLIGSSGTYNDKAGSIKITDQTGSNAICDEGWGEDDARAVCRSLGYWSSSPTVYQDNWFGRSSGGGKVISPQCHGNEANLALCPLGKEWGKQSCITGDLAGVKCTPAPLGYRNIRLVDGGQPGRGRLEVRYNGNWGSVCSSGWTQLDTVVVCRMLRYRSTNMTSYEMTQGTQPILIGDIGCLGNETDIGMCKADLDKTNCTDKVVGIDCTDHVVARLVNGSRPSEGRLEVYKDGHWGVVCRSGVDHIAAKVFCNMMGYSNTDPVISTSPTARGDSVRNVTIQQVTCEDWENHIDQCIQTSTSVSGCDHDHFVQLQCINCTYSFKSESGEILSRNYPQRNANSDDCLYAIMPPNNHTAYALTIQNVAMHDGNDTLYIREGNNGKVLGIFSQSNTVFPVLTGKAFWIRFKTHGSGSPREFRYSWKPLTIEDAITLNCGSSSWNTVVNMTILRALYPDVGVSQIYLSKQACTGTVMDDTIVFEQSYTECSTTKTTTDDNIVYHNQLVYPDSNTVFPVIIKGFNWRVDIDCSVKRKTNVTISYKPTEASVTATTVRHHLSGTSNYDIALSFFQDPGFFNEIKGNPVSTHIGDNIYVKVKVNSNDPEVKMRLDTCSAKPTANAGPDLTYTLIQNGCVVDQDTSIISQGSHETRFMFNAFEFPASPDSVFVSCNATFCRTTDLSPRCTQTCHVRSLRTSTGIITRSYKHKIDIYVLP